MYHSFITILSCCNYVPHHSSVTTFSHFMTYKAPLLQYPSIYPLKIHSLYNYNNCILHNKWLTVKYYYGVCTCSHVKWNIVILFTVPRPSARIIAPQILNFGQPLTLTCEVTTVRGITSAVIITWRSFGIEPRRVENASGIIVDGSVVYRDQLYISELTSENYYICRAVINSTSRPSYSAYYRVRFTCKYYYPYIHVMHTHVSIIY